MLTVDDMNDTITYLNARLVEIDKDIGELKVKYLSIERLIGRYQASILEMDNKPSHARTQEEALNAFFAIPSNRMKKIECMKIIKNEFGLSLKETKDIIESYMFRKALDNSPMYDSIE